MLTLVFVCANPGGSSAHVNATVVNALANDVFFQFVVILVAIFVVIAITSGLNLQRLESTKVG